MSDDPPRSGGYRYAGFESGLRRADGSRKPAYEGFRLPLAVEVYGRSDVLWGLVRPQRARDQGDDRAARERARRWRALKTLDTTAHRRLRAQDRASRGPALPRALDGPDGPTYAGPSVRGYS